MLSLKRFEQRFEGLERRITADNKSLEQRMTIKLGALFFASAGVCVGLLRFIN